MKQCRLSNIPESVKPDISINTETWLDPQIRDSEIFHSGYKLHRKDKSTSSGGGLLIVEKNVLSGQDVLEFDAECGIIWVKLNLVGNGTMYICSYYRQDILDNQHIDHFTNVVHRACSIRWCFLILWLGLEG